VRGAETHAAEEEARAAGDAWRAARLDVERDVKEAWAAYELASYALVIHREQIELAGKLVEVGRTLVATGRVSQDDVLRLDLEQARLHRDVARLERDQRGAVVKLNAFMGRDVAAPLGAPPAFELLPALPARAGLERLALEHRPELAEAGHRVRARQADTAARRHEANRPSLMVGADYMVMPEAEGVHGYGLMLAINLPWLNGGRDAEVRAAEAELRSQESEAAALRSTVTSEVGIAYAEVEAAVREFAIIRDELLPRAQRGLESARSTFSTGGGSTLAVLEAMRAWLDVRIEEAHALVDVRMAWASLERAVGTSLGEERP
jgi:outer membrane protein TolC